ncbi:MAG: copper-binding protein [Rhodospirillaceae bacterium]|nr:copper-binding protein [Rhodospirillaceae bacterium]
MSNPFTLYWKKNWTFQIVHMEGGIHIEAKGLGVSIRAPFEPNDNPMIAADSLILKEEKNRQSLYNSWKLKISNQKLNM